MKEFKIRASASGQIMTETGLTENQLKTIDQYQKKEKLTDKQKETLDTLIYKRDNPELPQGVKTYCETWLKEQLYNRKKDISNKYTQKGWIMEDNSLDFIADQLGYGMLLKNEEYYDSDFMQGTPDVVLKDLVIDVKNSWDNFTFPLFEKDIPNKDYYWQAQAYMLLTGRLNYKLIYVLSDTPEHLIVREVRRYVSDNGIDEIDTEIYESFKLKMTYPDIPDKLKIKVFDIERNDHDIEKIKKRVVECRKYIEILKNEI